jgi:hypothetical protein
MIFKTKTGSVYEVDAEANKIRRLQGKNAPTSRQGQDGDWKQYEYISPPKVGSGVTIVWGSDTPLFKETLKHMSDTTVAIPTTYTSDVVYIEE